MFCPVHQGGQSLSTVTITIEIIGNDVSLLFNKGGQQYVLTADTTTQKGVLASVTYSTIINLRDRPLEKVWGGGGGGKSPKKFMQGKMPRKKNSCKEEGKEKKFMQKDGPIVHFRVRYDR